jgi:hypothetical protein
MVIGSVSSVTSDRTSASVTGNTNALATPGLKDLVYETAGGTAHLAWWVGLPPTLTTLAPTDGFQGQTLTATFTGTGLASASGVVSGNPGITGTILSASDTEVTVAVTIGAGAAVGSTTLGIQTALGSASLPFTVYAGTPVEYADFADLSAFQLNGSAEWINANPVVYGGQPVLRLTDNYGQGGSAYLSDTIDLEVGGLPTSFSTAFQFQITDSAGIDDGDGVGADGLVFIVQTAGSSVGGSGVGIGYDGVSPSVAVEFDTYDNGGIDAGGNHIGIGLNGDIDSVVKVPVTTRMNDGNIWYAWVDYDGATQTLEVRLAQTGTRPAAATASLVVDLAAQIRQPEAFVGFTSGTGGATGDHDIRAWKLRNTYDPFGDW